ncbi:MAG TPA: hypothetical protein VLK84_08645 [Longimicrobium sp.]|nr:hypothetical protein [Longimicrobium sp.]
MARQVTVSAMREVRNGPAIVRDEFKHKRLLAYSLKSSINTVPAITVITAELVMEIEGETVCREKEFRMVLAGTDGLPADVGAGEWVVFTWAL